MILSSHQRDVSPIPDVPRVHHKPFSTLLKQISQSKHTPSHRCLHTHVRGYQLHNHIHPKSITIALPQSRPTTRFKGSSIKTSHSHRTTTIRSSKSHVISTIHQWHTLSPHLYTDIHAYHPPLLQTRFTQTSKLNRKTGFNTHAIVNNRTLYTTYSNQTPVPSRSV